MDQVSQNNQAPVVTSGTSEDTKTLVTVLLLIFFYPAGVILMWVWTKWKMWVKALITALGCLPIIFFFFFMIFAAVLAIGNPEVQDELRKSGAREECFKSCALEESPTSKANCEKVCSMFPGTGE